MLSGGTFVYMWRIVDGIVNDYCMKIFYEFSTHNERQQGKGMLKPHKPKRTLYIIVNALLIALLHISDKVHVLTKIE